MLHCVRLYALTVRVYFKIYNDNPVQGPKEGQVEKVFNENEKGILNAKELFRQMVRGMKSHLNDYYCEQEQSDRCEFSYYMNNYQENLSEDEQDSLIAGKASAKVIDKLFPDFAAAEQALPSLQPK
jgi:hypothetical protein